MARIVILGGGVCGLAAGLMLARDDHDVTLLERDPAPVPASPLAAWGAGLEIIGCLAQPEEVLARPGLADRVREVAGDGAAPLDLGREDVLRLVA